MASASRRLVAHVDMNSYFASVEQQANPTLRGKPLGVCSYLHPYGCVIAASIEAKRVGIKVGMTMTEARRACPSAVFVENDPAKYRAVTARVFPLFHELTDRVEHYSIDEAFLDLTGWYRDAAEAAWALTRVRQRITDEVGDWLRCSIGIAPTRFLAKTASDMEKPNGLVVIDYENLDEMLGRLDLEDVCGIGRRIRRRLERIGITTLLELKRYPVANLMSVMGKYGYFLWCKVNGLEMESVRTDAELPPKSIGHSYCVPDRVNRERKVEAVLLRLLERAGRRLRAEGYLAGRVTVMVGFHRGATGPRGPFWQPSMDEGGAMDFIFPEPANDSFTLTHATRELLCDLWHGERVNFLAVTLSDFSKPNGQQRLRMGDPCGRPDRKGQAQGLPVQWDPFSDRRRLVSNAIDAVRDRYGDGSIMLASMMKLGDEAPDRIGFRKVGVDFGSIL